MARAWCTRARVAWRSVEAAQRAFDRVAVHRFFDTPRSDAVECALRRFSVVPDDARLHHACAEHSARLVYARASIGAALKRRGARSTVSLRSGSNPAQRCG
eukprot:7964609-Lingulodinium_polyedra.AAC.1